MRVSADRTYGNLLRAALRAAGERLCAGVGLSTRRRHRGGVPTAAVGGTCATSRLPRPAPPDNPGVLVEVMLSQGRYALLLRPQIVGNLNGDQRGRAVAALAAHTALVKTGPVVVLGMADALADLSDAALESAPSGAEAIVVDAFFLDRKLVTNREFRLFVAAGGYEEPSIWDQEVWPVVAEFVDRTGEPGPRFWSRGRFDPQFERHPVVGVSWYEASAYARWLGKRLPTDAEWVRAASSPILLPGGELRQRRFPWGDRPDRGKANLWGTNPAGTLPVDALPQGDSAGGIGQMIGNVWEWTAGDLDLESWTRLSAEGSLQSTARKSLRGGAFDTYFDVQATCQFQSGDHPLARKHNIGFRCSLGSCDLQPPADPLPATDALSAADSSAADDMQPADALLVEAES